jgi:hypothetical protein
MTPASTLSAPQGVDSSTAPRRLKCLVIRGGGAPDVHVYLYVGRGQGSASDVAEVERTKPKALRAHNTPPSIQWGEVDQHPSQQSVGGGFRVGWGQANSPRAGPVGPTGEEGPRLLQDVTSFS